jgi:SAM-dependent methyltransferase
LSLDPLAAGGFGTAELAEQYERARPGYPPEALARITDELWLGPGRRVLDLAAGTGKLTRQLVATGAEVVAVEPLASMREACAAAVPAVEVLEGTAESIPLPDSSVDAVTVAQAFHWFDPVAAFAEIARVLRTGGGLALVWNEQDESIPWVAELGRAMHRSAQCPHDETTDWADVVANDGAGRFTPLRTQLLHFEQEMDVDLLCERVASSSYIAVMPEGERDALLRHVRAVVEGFPPVFGLPYVCELHWCHRSSS